ncbi:MAG TPA: hypothetical protein VFG72_06095 [Marmoricola sp.]|nr:hypothetical protein [Marmoricola sp.]
MADLTVDFAVLEGSEHALRTLKSELDTIEDRRDDTGHVWGHDGLRDAMHEFASNMRHHRQELSRKIQDNGEKVAASLEAFREAELSLSSELDFDLTTGAGRRP